MDPNIVMTQFTASAVFVWAMQRLKKARWFPLLQEKGQIWLKRALSLTAAICIHTGITHVWSAGTLPGYHVVMITIPPLPIIALEIWHWIGQYAIQEGFYQFSCNRPPGTITEDRRAA